MRTVLGVILWIFLGKKKEKIFEIGLRNYFLLRFPTAIIFWREVLNEEACSEGDLPTHKSIKIDIRGYSTTTWHYSRDALGRVSDLTRSPLHTITSRRALSNPKRFQLIVSRFDFFSKYFCFDQYFPMIASISVKCLTTVIVA